MVTLDTSVLVDLFLPVEEKRKVKAKGIIEIAEDCSWKGFGENRESYAMGKGVSQGFGVVKAN